MASGLSRKRLCLTAALTLGWLAMAPLAQAQGVPQAANGVGSPFELAFWQSVGNGEDPALYEAYLQQYPTGTFAPIARAKVAALRKAATTVAAPAPAPQVALPAASPVAPAEPTPVSTPRPAGNGPALAMAMPMPLPAAPGAPLPSPAASAASGAMLGQMLAELARSQETPGAGATSLPPAVAAVSPVSSRHALPARPQLAPVPDLTLPTSFCSADERNRFHDGIYAPALEAAKRNNDAAVAYLTQLQGIYDGYQLGRDTEAMNALAAESRSYQADAAATFSAQAAMVRTFDALMAVPVRPCGAAR
ncbi:hypothetical protein OLX02_00055 [Novosphingobium sp. KCTC 2891]|uniref:hypothetical protein n=1 Tax=Novosphingobium sp. KCTC 2891 TaxID=2989730 RepID=UPI00222176BE|nr:hypothetical protein [Novosphingobium sp. KCTC 2891]MCW1381203.1 hypothetical protein [Novosphingobium sp. KCTC 2891]